MVIVECCVPSCAFSTADVSEALAIALLANHGFVHQNPPAQATAQAPTFQGPKLARPTVDIGVSIEEWNVFTRRWEVFRAGSGIGDAQAPFQLFQCAGPNLGDSLLKADPDAASRPLPDLIAAMRSLAVIPVATCVLRTELLQLHQERDETFRAFAARVRGKAETCAYATVCECGRDVDFTDHIIRDVLINGIYDSDIRRATLGISDVLRKPVNDVIALVESREMAKEIHATRYGCADCNRNAPSQAATPPLPSSPPSTPFEAVFADFFDYGGRHYLVVGDRLSGWVEVLSSTAGTDLGGSAGLVRHLRSFFATFGVPEELSSDGGPEFMSSLTENFFRLWCIRHRVSSVGFPQSNGRAEVAVKTAKRLLVSNTGPTGTLDNDRFLRAMLQLRNTPDPDCNLSPAQIIFGRPLRDSLSFINRLEKFSSPHIRPLWRQAWAAKEDALRTRLSRTTESLRAHSRPLRPLALGETVFIQNQMGPSPHKWDRSGVVVESLGHDQYRVKVDGSGRLTLRNRRFLRAFTPAAPCIGQPPSGSLPLPLAQVLVPPSVLTGPVVSRVNPRLPNDVPRDSASDVDVPAPSDGPPVGLVARGVPVAVDAAPAATTPPSRSPPLLPPTPHPCRVRRPPRRYEPESGRWIRG
ncbi:uncharacterized protein LOC144001771 [Festucalex cinctus]